MGERPRLDAGTMHVYVTPEQFEAIHAANQRVVCGGPTEGLRRLLADCSATNGGDYDAARHASGARVQINVIV